MSIEQYIVSITYELSKRGVSSHHRRELTPMASDALTAIQDAVGLLRDEVRMENPDSHLLDVTVRCIVTE